MSGTCKERRVCREDPPPGPTGLRARQQRSGTAGPYDRWVDDDEDFVLGGQLCFALHDASRAMTAAYRPQLAAIGLTYTQYAVLLVLWDRPEVSFRELAAAMHMDSATLSPLLRRMADNGHLARSRSGVDERTVTITLSEAGADLRDPAQRVQAEVERATGLSRGELVALRDQLHALADRLRTAQQP
jgi:DNA-binding MarR family transcriptional regulator